MKKRLFTTVIAGVATLAIGTSVFAAGGYSLASKENETEGTQITQEDENAVLSDKLFDFQMLIDGDLYQFPMTYKAFEANGWKESDQYNDFTKDDELSPGQYTLYYFNKPSGANCMVYVLNIDVNNKKIEDCLIGGISMSNSDQKNGDAGVEVEFPKGIKMFESTQDDIINAYGNPENLYENDFMNTASYEKDLYSTAEFSVYNKDGTLQDFDIMNFEVPDDFSYGNVDSDIPEDVTAYSAPDELGNDLDEYTVRVDGALYKIPAPVNEFEKNGWSIDGDSASAIPAHSSDWVTMTKDGHSFKELVRNSADYATVPSNCWVESIQSGAYEMDVDTAVASGIEKGISKDELEAYLDSNNIDYEKEESDTITSYEIGNYEKGYTFDVLTEDNGTFPVNTVYQIEVKNPVE